MPGVRRARGQSTFRVFMPTQRERRAAKEREAAALAAELHDPEAPTARDRRKAAREQARALAEEPLPQPGPPVEGFCAAEAFDGARPGFVFKLGTCGIGYYPDDEANLTAGLSGATSGCHYDVLGVSMDASADGLRKAYRKRALACHPDRNLDDPEAAAERFKAIQAAYETLSDDAERRFYDLHRDSILAARAAAHASPPTSMAVAEAADEPEAMELWSYFMPGACLDADTDGVGDVEGFYAVLDRVFSALDTEEAAVCSWYGQAPPERRPQFGGADTSWDEVVSFYAVWEAFETARSGSADDHYSAAQVARAANRQQRRSMERENERRRAACRRRREECVRALVAHTRRRDPRVAAHEASERAAAAEKPTSRRHTDRVSPWGCNVAWGW